MIDSPPGGNNNGRLDPGEDGELIVALRNAGNEPADSVFTRLRSGNPLFVITDSAASYGTIPAGSTRTNASDPFAVHVDASIPIETPIPCTLLFDASGYADTFAFVVIIGELRAFDPIPDGPRQPPLYWAYDDVDTTYSEHPVFEWVEIRTQGTMISFPNNDAVVTIDLPSGFGPFQYYGQQSTQLTVSADGWVCPGSCTRTNYTNTSLPNASAPSGVIAVNWDDLYPGYNGQGHVYWYHDAANHRFVVEYDSIPYYDSRTCWDCFELVLYDTTVATPTGNNVFVAQYLTANNYTANTVGIQDPGKTIGIQCLYNGTRHRGAAPLEAGRAIKYTTVEPVTGVAEEHPTHLPKALGVLVRAHPNPFTQTTLLSVQLGAPQVVSVHVYDNTGRLVRILAKNRLVASRARFSWDGRNQDGRAVGSGIYFYQVSSEQADSWGKVVLSR